MKDYNPIPFNACIRDWLSCFDVSFTDNVRDSLRRKVYESGGGGVHYDSSKDEFEDFIECYDYNGYVIGLEQQTKPLSFYMEKEITIKAEKVVRFLKDYCVNPSRLFLIARIQEFDGFLRAAADAYCTLPLDTRLKNTCLQSLLSLYQKSESVHLQIELHRDDEDKKFWKEFFSDKHGIRVFKSVVPPEKWINTVLAALSEYCINPDQHNQFKQLFQLTGICDYPIKPIKWFYRDKANGKIDQGSIVALIYLLIEYELIIKNWDTDKELTDRIQRLFCTEAGTSITIGSAAISKNRNKGTVKFPNLKKQLEILPICQSKENSKET